jgi:predicted acyl esterase
VRTDYPQLVVGWFDRWLRAGPETVAPGVVEYQDDDGDWHTSDAWPPRGNTTTLHLAGRTLALEQGAAEPQLAVTANEVDPSLAVCGPHHALYVSPPLAEDVLLAGHFHANLSLASTLPDGNLAIYLFRTPGSGACPDLQAREVRRALTDLRHRGSLEVGQDFPLGSPGQVDVRSHPFAAQVKAGERLVLSVGGGSTELQPRPFKPVLRVEGGSLALTAVEGQLRFA